MKALFSCALSSRVWEPQMIEVVGAVQLNGPSLLFSNEERRMMESPRFRGE